MSETASPASPSSSNTAEGRVIEDEAVERDAVEHDALDRFGLDAADQAHIETLRRGHIHRTLLVGPANAAPLFVLQGLNTRIFPDPDAVAHNIAVVTECQRRQVAARGGEVERSVLQVVPTTGGEPYARLHDGSCWRLFRFIHDSHAHLEARTPDQAFQTARAIGQFQQDLGDIDPAELRETIPAFHDTPARVARLEAVIGADPVGRASSCSDLIERALAKRTLADVLLAPWRRGEIPQRIAHNDAKIGNVLFDDNEHPLCVIDLDTVMPGLSLYDFGEMVRSMSSDAAEDDADERSVVVVRERLEAMAAGYLDSAGDMLCDLEKRHLLDAGRLMTYENGVRFLTDHLEGDVYYPVHHEGHNLERARNQFALLAQLDLEPPL